MAPLPGVRPRMESYFLRENDVAGVNPEDLAKLWEEDCIAIHYPGDDEDDLRSLNPGDYRTRMEKNAIRTFARLAREGGYVWCQCPGQDYDLLGKVEAGTKVQFVESTWTQGRMASDDQGGRPAGAIAVLKTLQLVQAKRVGQGELHGLRAARPRKACISQWDACGNRLKAFVDDKLLAIEWRELSRELQETACAEFLRHHEHDSLPKLKFLMMPVGRTFQDLDIYGLSGDDKVLYAQVSHTKPDFLDGTGKLGPLIAMRKRSPDAELVYFGDVPTITARDGIWVVPTAEVFEFLWKNPEYLHRLFLF